MFWNSKEFVYQLLQRNENAFTKFYEDTVDIFFRYLKSQYNLDEQSAQDILSETYVKFWNSIDGLKINQNIQSYCWTILRNCTIDYFKKNKEIQFSNLETDSEDNNFEQNIESEENIKDLFELQFQSEQIQKAIESLDIMYKDVIFLKYIQELSNNEIAQFLGIQEDNVRQRLSRWLAKLRKLLE